jgi:hypothetical protein
MNTMKRITVMTIALIFLSATGICFAGSAIPNIVGTWSTKSEGGVLLKGDKTGPKTHHDPADFTAVTGELTVTKQQGRILHGVFTSPKGSENLVGAVGQDNKTLYFADEDGTFEGRIVGKGKIEGVYRHVTPSDTVIAVFTWVRKK